MTYNQLELLPPQKSNYLISNFSYGELCQDSERRKLEKHFLPVLNITKKNNRQSVSFQLSKNNGAYGWFRYKEGFSSKLVEQFLKEMNLSKGATVLDPFVGSGTTSLVCSQLGISSIGCDILPTSKISVTAKANINKYNIGEIEYIINKLNNLKRPSSFKKRINWVNITEFAYPDETDYDLCYLNHWIENSNFSDNATTLLKLAILNSLESISYTSKSGQYLKWDSRSQKIKNRNAKRKERNLPPLKSTLDKGNLPHAYPTISKELKIMLNDIKNYQSSNKDSKMSFIQDSILHSLPKLDSNSINGVITSPPYLNRYDYTRTYALELAYLGLSNQELKQLRQKLLSSTVENKTKIPWLKDLYSHLHKENDYNKVINFLRSDAVLQEINTAMIEREKNGDLNNKGIIRMVKGYFDELSFIIFELHRILRKGALFFTVNDNVRYGGEVIPVDFISSHIAESFGFEVVRIDTIPQQKGNSSQQMKKFGRVPLRKSITVWKNL